MKIHPTAIIHPSAELAEDVEVGPYCIIEEDVKIDSGTRLLANVIVDKWTTIGKNNIIHYGAVIGHDPQHTKYDGSHTYTRVGDNNVIREYVTIHRSFLAEQATVIGDNNFLMAMSHMGHDTKVGSNCIIANGTLLGGHVVVDDRAYLSGNVAIHQYCQIGTLAMIAALTRITMDVLPFSIIEGDSFFRGINVVGLRRAGFSPERRKHIEEAFRILLWRNLTTPEAIKEMERLNSPDVALIIEKIQSSKRGFCRPRIAQRRHRLESFQDDHDGSSG